MSQSENDKASNVSRRGMLKWAGALAAVGVVGVGLGLGGDLLIRPNTTSTTVETNVSTKSVTATQTETAIQTQVSTQTEVSTATATQPAVTQAVTRTATVTQPAVTQAVTQTATVTAPAVTQTQTATVTTTSVQQPVTLSYVPPLSPQIQTKVSQMVGSLVSAHQGETVAYTTCSGTQCQRYCLLKVRMKNGIITAFEPDDTINKNVAMEDQYLDWTNLMLINVQSRPCPMAYCFREKIYDPNRVIYPMQRVGPRGSGQWQRVSIDYAVTTVAQWLQTTKSTYGPLSIWHDSYSCSGTSSFPLANWFGAGVTGWDCHSGNGWGRPSAWVGAQGGTNDIMNQSQAKLIVLWGNNPVQIQQGEWNWYLRQFREKGIPIVCIEHRYTWTAESLATQFIAIRPGTDVVMIIAMANVMFKENLWNQAFVSKWVEPTGFAQWKGYVLGTIAGPDGMIDRTPEWAEAICGVPAATIKAFAEYYVNNSPVQLCFGGGGYRQMFGENNSRAIMYLQAITGNMGIPGANLSTYSGPSCIGGTAPSVNWQRATATYSAPTRFAAMKWAKTILYKQDIDAGRLTEAQVDGFVGNKIGNQLPNLKMLMFENNSIATSVDTSNVIKAVKSVDYVVTFTQETYRDNAKYADLLIPQAYCQFEGRQPSMGNSRFTPGQPDILFRSAGPITGKQWFYMQKCIDAPGDVQSEDYIWLQIANKLGIAAQYHPLLANVKSQAEWDQTVEKIHQTTYETWAASTTIAPLKPPTWTDFQKSPVWRWGITTPQYPGSATIAKGTSPFSTDSKLIEFVSPILSKGPTWLANNDYPTGGGICYGPGNLTVMATWQPPPTSGDHFYSPDVKQYPILLSTPHSYYRQHSWLDDSLMLQDLYRHGVWLSVPDAQARGIKDGDLVRVFNMQGEMIIPAYVTSRLVPGTGALYETSWYQPNKETTSTMPDGIDRRGCCNFVCRDIDVPQTVVGHYNCKGLVEIQKI